MRRIKQKTGITEFSKIILCIAAFVNIAVIAFTMIMIIITLDLTPLCYLIPAISAEVATGTGFYYAKAKAENKIKLMSKYKVQPTEESFKD